MLHKHCLIIALLTLNIGWITAQVLDAPPPQNRAWSKEGTNGHVIHRKPITYTYLREADVMWAKRIWRKVDLREKINLPMYYPSPNPVRDRKSLTTILWQAAVETKTLRVYDDEDFTKPTTPDDIRAKVESVDTIETPDPNDPTIMIPTIVKTDFSPADVKTYIIIEDWFFDKQRSVMDVRILAIAPIVDKYVVNPATNEREYKGMLELFFIYFPDARPLLASHEVYNRQNDAERRSFDDLFWKRMFGSYIYKEENVFNRMISDYKKNLDALLEAEKIKQDIFVIEHDLWEY